MTKVWNRRAAICTFIILYSVYTLATAKSTVGVEKKDGKSSFDVLE